MKNLKKVFLILCVGAFMLTSCENEDVLIDDPMLVTQESESIVEALAKMSTNFDDDGNVESSSNPAGNIIFDFCFDFVYPITLSYNTGATVAVNDLNGLINIIINSTDQLYINGIAFPFDVETYSSTSDAIVIETITNEEDFSNLLLSCDFTDVVNCECYEVYDPVCVEISDPNGVPFTISYPNDCYAFCDGFTEADFVEDCTGGDFFDFGFGCFTLNYPLDLVLDNGTTISINSDGELGNAMYNQYVANFVYPISVSLIADESQVTVNNLEEFEMLFANCFGGGQGGGLDCEECENEPIEPVCIQYVDDAGNTVIEIFPNLCYAECLGFTGADVVDCDDDNPSDDCTEQDVFDALVACNSWSAEVSGIPFFYEFELNTNLVNVEDEQGNTVTTGVYEVIEEAPTGNVFIVINTDSGNFGDVWYFFDCNSPDGFQIVSSSSAINNVQQNCD